MPTHTHTIKLPHWIAWCEAHGEIEVHQDTPPAKCHHTVRIGVRCNRKLQRIRLAQRERKAS